MIIAMIALVAVRIGVIAAIRDYEIYSFEQYLREFGFSYSSIERERREDLFKLALGKVQTRNRLYKNGNSTWYAAMNEYSVMDATELAAMMMGNAAPPSAVTGYADPIATTGDVHDPQIPSLTPLKKLAVPNPPRKDWREFGVVSPVRQQGSCGSCWAFASTAVIESHYMIASKTHGVVLAPQYLLNCVRNPHDCGGKGGCGGATSQLAFNLTSHFGMPFETELPYTAKAAACRTYPQHVATGGYHCLQANDGNALETAIATVGPVVVNVCAWMWMMYGGGIFKGGCPCFNKGLGCPINHAVVAVGYDVDYWLIMNSWGKDWGEDGYIRLSRSSDKDVYIDYEPDDGVACKPYQKTEVVGGESGVLSSSCYPRHVHKVNQDIVV